MKYVICQLPITCDYKFRGYNKEKFNPNDYVGVWMDEIDGPADESTCERLFEMFNCGPSPKGYAGHSISVSDLIILIDDVATTYYCDEIGWVKIENNLMD